LFLVARYVVMYVVDFQLTTVLYTILFAKFNQKQTVFSSQSQFL